MNAIPVFEAKNRLPFYIHKAETEGIIPISRHNNVVAYIISREDFDELKKPDTPKKSLVQMIHDSRSDFGLTDDDDFDYTEYFDSLRDRNYFGRPGSEHIFDDI